MPKQRQMRLCNIRIHNAGSKSGPWAVILEYTSDGVSICHSRTAPVGTAINGQYATPHGRYNTLEQAVAAIIVGDAE